jgi:hypothetical protein
MFRLFRGRRRKPLCRGTDDFFLNAPCERSERSEVSPLFLLVAVRARALPEKTENPRSRERVWATPYPRAGPGNFAPPPSRPLCHRGPREGRQQAPGWAAARATALNLDGGRGANLWDRADRKAPAVGRKNSRVFERKCRPRGFARSTSSRAAMVFGRGRGAGCGPGHRERRGAVRGSRPAGMRRTGGAEAEVVVAVLRIVPVAVRGAAVPGVVCPSAAPDDPVLGARSGPHPR